MLAGLPQAPSRYSPFRHPDRARQRQIYVLSRMVDEGMIRADQAKVAIDTTLDIKPRRNWFFEEVPVYTEHVRRYVIEHYGEARLLEDGLQIHTAVNVDLQKVAALETQKGLKDLDRRHGYRGPLDHLESGAVKAWIDRRAAAKAPATGEMIEAVVETVDNAAKTAVVHMGHRRGLIGPEDLRWAQAGKNGRALKPGDLVRVRIKDAPAPEENAACSLEQVPEAEAALLCMEAGTGLVRAMVGGRDFTSSQFNRAVQSRRQPGSAFKPIIYAAAIDKGFTPASVLIDSPVVFHDREHDMTWKPQNYGQKFYGPTTLRQALAKSRNVVTVKLLREIGVAYVIDYARNLGIESPLEPNLSIALGSSGVSLLEMVRAYAVFANLGERVEPVFVTRIVDRDGRVLETSRVERRSVIAPSTAYIMTSLLESVVQEGTGSRVKALNRPAAGKTGTTDDLHDAWFVGFTPSHVTGVWVGLDDEATLGQGETGARAASPIWLGFMQAVVADKPVEVFRVPEGVVFSRIDAETGLLPIAESKETRFECFKEGTEPTTYTSRPDEIVRPESFYKSDI